MKEYIKPTYFIEAVETADIMLPSLEALDGEYTVGNITGSKAVFNTSFSDLLGNR